MMVAIFFHHQTGSYCYYQHMVAAMLNFGLMLWLEQAFGRQRLHIFASEGFIGFAASSLCKIFYPKVHSRHLILFCYPSTTIYK